MQNFIFTIHGSVSQQTPDSEVATERVEEFIRRAGALAEEMGFHVFYLRQSPDDPQQPGFSSER